MENVKTYFISLLNAAHTQTINVSTTCGIALVKEAAPIVVLHPTLSGAFYYSRGGALDIVGGPGRGLQVNSSSATGIQWLASAVIDLSLGGPNQAGSDVGIVGGPTTIPTNVGVPTSSKSVVPGTTTSGTWVAHHTDGCPDNTNSTGNSAQACKQFGPGYYPSGINLPSVMNKYLTAIFKPGIYYMNGSLVASGSNRLRMAKPADYQQTDGVMFYFLTGSWNCSGCTGCQRSGIDNVASTYLTCDGSAPVASLGMASTIFGNILYGQCTKNGTYWDAGGDMSDSRGSPGTRGLLMFHDHGDTTQPVFSGSGALSFSGALYIHSSSYTNVLTLNGGSSSGTFILGEIITDQVSLTGSGTIKLALNPAATTSVAKVSIVNECTSACAPVCYKRLAAAGTASG